jgi:hypothetical protein
MSSDEKTLIILTPGFPGSEADTTCLPMQQNLVRSLKVMYPQMNIIILSFQYPYFKKKYTWFDTMVISFDGRNKGGLARLLLRRKLNATLKEINNTKNNRAVKFWYGECALWVQDLEKNNINIIAGCLADARKKMNASDTTKS